MTKLLMSGNEAMAEGAIRAGCRLYAGYPITPQNEFPAYMARHMPAAGGVFIQAESELAAINMVFGAALTGERAMTSSSSPGISLKQEGISYLAGAELPAVIVNVMRGGPGLGNISPAQSDYFQATKGGGHGDYHCLVLAPATVQESFSFMSEAFNLSDKYRNPVLVLTDGLLGQMMEPLDTRYAMRTTQYEKKWALTGCAGRRPNIIRSLYLGEGALERVNLNIQKKYKVILDKEQRWEEFLTKDAHIILVAYGTMARIAKSAVKQLRAKGKKIGLIRPITLWPFPVKAFKRNTQSAQRRNTYLTIEMSCGQMVEDVCLAVNGKAKVEFLGRSGGGIPSEEEIISKVKRLVR